MKLRVQLHQVKERSGTWEGKAYKNSEATGTIFTAAGEFFGMLLGNRLPEHLKDSKPGMYDAEVSFEYATDIRAFRPRIESLVPLKA